MKHLFTLAVLLLALSAYSQDRTLQVENQLKILDETLDRIRVDIESIEGNQLFPVPNLLLKQERELQKRKDELVQLLGTGFEISNSDKFQNRHFQPSYENTAKSIAPTGSSGRIQENHLLELTRNDSSVTQAWDEEILTLVDSAKSYSTYNEQGQLVLAETFILIDGEWHNYSKSEYAFDSDGNQILNAFYYWDLETNNWKGSWKSEYVFDSDGNRILSIYYSWNSETASWEGNWKSEYEFDAEGRQISYASYHWDSETASWKGNWKDDSQYNADGNRIVSVSYIWNSETDEWTRDSKQEYEYNESANLIKQIFYIPLEGEWEYNWEYNYTFTYDDHGNIIERITLYSSDKSATNTNSYKDEYEYDEFGNLTMLSYSHWSNNEWKILYKLEHTFDSKGNRASAAYYYSDWQTGEIIGSFKYQLILDEDENSTGIIYYQWNEATNDWIASEKYETELEGEAVYSRWNPDTGSWDLIYKTFYYSSVFFEAIAELPGQEVHSGLTIKLSIDDYFTVYDDRTLKYEVTTQEGLVEASVEDGIITVTAKQDLGKDTVSLVIHLTPTHSVTQSFEVTVIEPLGIKNLSNAFAVYPNPAISYLAIKPGYFSQKAMWKLINLSGTGMKEGTIQENQIDLAGYKPGLYILQVYDQGRTTNFKFIKE